MKPAALARALLTRTLAAGRAGGSVTAVALKPAEAREACAALARALYARLFAWLIERCNAGVNEGQEDAQRAAVAALKQRLAALGDDAARVREPLSVGVLDIFGFEVFERNGFEQVRAHRRRNG